MKTSEIQLENHDDVVSIKDKMSWFTSQRTILVWPKRGRILKSELDLALLQRAARSLGSDLALVTHHEMIREWAEALAIPVYASISTAENEEWKRPAERIKEKRHPKGFAVLQEAKTKVPLSNTTRVTSRFQRGAALFFSLGAFLALFFVLVPSAEITYYPETRLQEIEIAVDASEKYTGINPSGSIPAVMNYMELSGERSRPSSGKTVVPTSKARGSVTFTNLTLSPITLTKGTFVLTSMPEAKIFILLEDVHVAGGTDSTAEGEVEAQTPGLDGNIEAEEVSSVAGDSGALVSVDNAWAFSGGGGVETPSPSEEDYKILQDQLLADLLVQGISGFQTQLEPGKVLIEQSIGLEKILLNEQINRIDQPSDEAVLRLTVRLKALTFEEADLQSIAAMILTGNKPEGYQALDEKISVLPVSDILVDEHHQVSWTVRASRLLEPEWNLNNAAQQLAGKKVTEAEEIFSESFSQIKPANIKLFIKGWPWMPFLSTRIHFVNGTSA